jgi:pyruvate,water dikinase
VNNIYWLDKIKPSDKQAGCLFDDDAGDEAFYQGYLMQEGYPVIPGFVIPPEFFWQFIRKIEWSDPLFAELPNSSLHINVADWKQLQAIAQGIRFYITTAPLPPELLSQLESAIDHLKAELLIFRPSLNSSAPDISGIVETRVCSSEIDEFISTIKLMWAEFFSAKSLFYWQQKQIFTEQLKPTILVQSVPRAIASGNLKAGRKIWEIKATFGLEFSIIRGEVFPDYYQINPETQTIIDKILGSKTIAYNLDGPTEAETTRAQFPLPESLAALPVYLLSEEKQNQFSLSEKETKKLIKLSKTLTTILGNNFYLEWTLAKLPENQEPQFYFTLARPLNKTEDIRELEAENLPLEKTKNSEDNSGIIKGLAAATGRVKAIAKVLRNPPQNNEDFPEGKILVVPSVIPAYFPLVTKAAGIISERGGMTSHGAILARELGIPAVVGANNATRIIEDGEAVFIDGDAGEIYLIEREIMINQEPSQAEEKTLITDFSFPLATQLLVNISQLNSLEIVKKYPVDGVGLLRSELMAIELLGNQHPLMWVQQNRESEFVELMSDRLTQFAAAFSPRPVFYRSLDLLPFNPLKEGSSFTNYEEDSHPILGLHGTFNYMLDSSLFDLEIKVLERVYQSGFDNVHLILPFVRTLEEFVFCRRRVEEMWKEKPANFEIWIMAEVPSVLFLLPEYVKAGVGGISIGTNDLTQLLLGANREQPEMATALPPYHPAVMRAIKQLISLANTAGIPCSICGDAPALYPQIIDDLVPWGITSISVNPNAVEATYRAIARAEHRLLLEVARESAKKPGFLEKP